MPEDTDPGGAAAPDIKALLLVDMQRSALPETPYGVPNMAELTESANRAIAACREAGVPVIFTRHFQLPTFIGLGGTSVADEYRSQGGVELAPGIDYRPEVDQCLDKQHWSAFRNTDFEDRLAVLPGTRLALAGTVTDCCVQQTAYDAFVRQIPVVFIQDAIGAASEAQHSSAMLSLANWVYGSRVASADCFARWLRGQPFDGWVWSRAYEFPYTFETMRAEYERLTGQSRLRATG